MAEIVLAAIIKKSAEIAGKLLVQEGSRLYWLKEDINWIQREARHIQSYLGDANAKVVGGDLRVKNLIKDIEELADDVEDILDEFVAKVKSHESQEQIGCYKEVIFHTYSTKKFAMEIEKIKRRVAEIDRVRTTYGITGDYNQHDHSPFDRRRLFLQADETEMIGMDNNLRILQAKLLDRDVRYEVIAIVGMPGLGKTTLAKKLYKHVCDQFECSAVVYVSQQPRVGELLYDIAKQVGLSEEECRHNFEQNLLSLLKRKRYVILLDDIWDAETWDDLNLVFPECDSKTGSKIIITSRKSDVGRYIGGHSSLHELQPLDPWKSFELFTEKIFTLDKNYWVSTPPNLKVIGRNIVVKCGGIPLTIVVIAGMLRKRERTEHAWNRVLETIGQSIHDQCSMILRLSYNDLPIALRPCFLYFGLFPEDYRINAFELINMWVAEKFIVSSNGNRQEIEDIGEDFLNDLVSRSLIQVSRRTFRGKIASCRIHDLLHSLCITLAKENNFFLTKDNASSDTARLRRLAFYSGGTDKFFASYPKPKYIRALLSSDKACTTSHLKTYFNFMLLRVLSLHIDGSVYDRAISIPEEIGNMSSLGYLKLSGPNFCGIMPHSIVKLKCLLTLDVQWTNIRVVDYFMEMKQLRHLRLSRSSGHSLLSKLGTLFSSYVLLPNLQTLIGMDDYYMKAGWLRQMIGLRKLDLEVYNKSSVDVFSSSHDEAALPKLEELKLNTAMLLGRVPEINFSSYNNLVKLNLKYTDFQAFPENLIKLSLWCVLLDANHVMMIKRLSKLKILKLHTCSLRGLTDKMDFSGANSFPQLEELHITGHDQWELIVDELGMPKLKKVIVYNTFRGKIPQRLAGLAIYKLPKWSVF